MNMLSEQFIRFQAVGLRLLRASEISGCLCIPTAALAAFQGLDWVRVQSRFTAADKVSRSGGRVDSFDLGVPVTVE